MQTNTREIILAILIKHPDSSAGEISRQLLMTKANVQYHLFHLLEEGLVVSETKHKSGRGRPSLVFRPTITSRPDNYLQLAEALLKHIQMSAETSPQDWPKEIANLLIALPEHSGNLTERLVKSMGWFTEHKYQARWEPRPSGAQVLLNNCPYAALIQQYPELCKMDQFLLENSLSNPVKIIYTMADPGKSLVPPCVFRIV